MYQQQLNEELIQACEQGDLEKIRLLLTSPQIKNRYGCLADINASNGKPLKVACEFDNLAVVKYLLTSPEIIQAGGVHADIHANEEAALLQAYQGEHRDIVNFFMQELPVEKRPNIHAKEDLLFFYAMEKGDVAMVKHILEHGQYLPENYITAFGWACSYGHQQLINYLVLDYGIPRTAGLEENIRDYPELAIDQLFEQRQLHESLHEGLAVNQPRKKAKV